MSNDIYKSIIDGSPYGYACYKLDRFENGSYNFELVEINKAFSDLTGIRPHLPANSDTADIFPFDLGAEKDRLRLIGDIARNGGSCEFKKYFPERKRELRVKVLSAKDRRAAMVIYDCLPEGSVIPADHIISLAADKLVFWIADLDFKCKYISSSVENLLGYSAEEIYGLSAERVISGRSLQKAFATVNTELSNEKKQGLKDPKRNWVLELELTDKKGSSVWTESSFKFLRDPSDKPFALIGFSRNITNEILTREALKQSEENLRLILDSAAEGIFGTDLDGNCTFCNESCLKMLGYKKEPDLLGQSIGSIMQTGQGIEEGLSKDSAENLSGHSENGLFYRADGSLLPVEYFLHPQYRDGKAVGSVVTFFDITSRKKAETELRESERSKATLISNIPGMAYRCKFDREWTMQFVSEGCFELTGYRPESLLDNKVISFNGLILPEYRDRLWDEWNKSLKQRDVVREEYPIRTASGETKWVFEQGRGVYDEKGNIEALEGLIIDITDRKRKEEAIRYLNYHDTLTGLYNRMYYEEALARIDTPGSLPLSVLVGDINGLKLINDAFGHVKGDKLIIETSRLLRSCCREKDVLARTGGDEFCILMPRTDSEEAYEMLMKIQTACGIYNDRSVSEAYSISISLGFATKKADREDFSETVKSAEDHMYKRKLLEHKSSHSAIISAIKATMFEKNRNTQQHAERIAGLSKRLGVLLGLSRGDLDDLELLATLHDIGKVGIDENILNKPSELTEEETAAIRKHPEIGYRIAMASPELVSVADYILTHQERWDGAGYPLGLSGEGIPYMSRIIAIVDSYDSITHDRPYRKALKKEQAIEEIRRNAGVQFDPFIAEKFLELISKDVCAD